MAGKGRRRREKNFKASHGGDTRLPPPPIASQLDALPSKLREIMLLKRGLENPKDNQPGSLKKEAPHGKKTKTEKKSDSMLEAVAVVQTKEKKKGHETLSTSRDGEVDIEGGNIQDAKKGKRKREVEDLRFPSQGDDFSSANLSKRARRKKFLQERKNKNKKHRSDQILEYPAREKIKFGEVVQAPPKLPLPRAPKTQPSASQERLRLQAIEAFRKQRNWTSRPGSVVPPLSTVVPSASTE